ncbi:internal scaffolding protein [Microviridae sp.]|nr:internal scaffolding protein [Microviridae sp.]
MMENVNRKTGELTTREIRQHHERPRVQTPVGTESRTIQHHRELCDINNIVANFTRTGEIPLMLQNTKQPQYGDVSELTGDPLELLQKAEAIQERLQAEEIRLTEAKAEAEEKTRLEKASQDTAEPKPEPVGGDTITPPTD